MKRILSALVLSTLSVGACGGDDDDDASNTGGSSSAGTTSEAGEPGMPSGGAPESGGGGAPTGNVGCDPEEATTCQNEIDCPFVVDGTARMTAGVCGQGCLGKEESCAVDCITDELDMSSECATCYAQTVACTVENCLSDCLNDPEADKCKACQVESGCRAAFNECSGLPE